MQNYEYLRECIGNLENKDSGVGSSTTSNGTSDIGLQGNSLDDVNLTNIDFNFMKIENLLLPTAEESVDCISNRRVKQEKSTDTSSSDSIKHFGTASLNYNTFSNNINEVPHDMTIDNDESRIFNKEATVQCLGTEQMMKYYNCSSKFFVDNNNEDINSNVDKHVSCVKQNIRSELKHGIKIDSQGLSEGDGQVQRCEQCLMTFRYKRHLDRHLEGHEKNNCPHCNGKFARRKHLEIHLFRVHGERIVRHTHLCDVCPKSFPKRALLNRHRAKHNYQSGKVCSECGDMLKTDDKEHEQSQCRKKRFKCEQCSQTFSIEQTYLFHIQNHNNHKCPNCDVSFASKKKAHEHFKAVHMPKLSDSETTSNGE